MFAIKFVVDFKRKVTFRSPSTEFRAETIILDDFEMFFPSTSLSCAPPCTLRPSAADVRLD